MPATVLPGDCVKTSLFAVAGETEMLAEVPLILESVTETVVVSALYRVIAPLVPPETAETPVTKLIAVAAPKLIAVPPESVTFGVNAPIEPAPLNVRLCDPA